MSEEDLKREKAETLKKWLSHPGDTRGRVRSFGKHYVVTEYGFLEKDEKGVLRPLGDFARKQLKYRQGQQALDE